MKKFKIIKKKNNKFCIKQKTLFWYETMIGTNEYETYQDCVDLIYRHYNKDEVEIKTPLDI